MARPDHPGLTGVCSYCGCLDLAVIGTLAAEHATILDVAGALRVTAAAGDVAGALAAAAGLAALLGPHTRGEEQGLFAELGAVEEFAAPVARLCAEHDRLDAALDAVLAGDLSGVAGFLADLRRHVDREENGLFPAAAIALSPAALERLGG